MTVQLDLVEIKGKQEMTAQRVLLVKQARQELELLAQQVQQDRADHQQKKEIQARQALAVHKDRLEMMDRQGILLQAPQVRRVLLRLFLVQQDQQDLAVILEMMVPQVRQDLVDQQEILLLARLEPQDLRDRVVMKGI
jgi:hypothetical protein